MKTSETSVLVVGGGAAGAMLSLELARQGVEARTIDRASGPASTSKAITVHTRTAEIFEHIDLTAIVYLFDERRLLGVQAGNQIFQFFLPLHERASFSVETVHVRFQEGELALVVGVLPFQVLPS